MINELWSLLTEGLLASSAALLLVLATRSSWRRAFGASSVPLIWAAVPLSLLAVWLPGPSVPLADVDAVWRLAGQMVVADPQANAASELSQLRVSLLIAAWLAGGLWFAMRQISQQRAFYRRLGALSQRAPGLRYSSRSDIGPAVLGLLRPTVVLPANFDTRYSPDQREMILAHERSHLARGDIVANAVAATLRCVYWFNPLIHYAAGRLRQDHELASDADVLRQFPNSRRRYADTLLDVQLAVPGLPVGCLWQSSHALKERIVMMKKTSLNAGRSRLGVGAGALFLAVVACASWAAQPPGSAGEKVDAPAEAVAGSTEDRSIGYSKIAPPNYPSSAKDAGEEGRVIVGVVVAETGETERVWVEKSSKSDALDAAAMAAVESWNFDPEIRSGQPVRASALVPICFSLKEEVDCPAAENLDGLYIKPPHG